MLAVRLIQTDAELEAVGRLRYRVYVEEMARTQDHADHHARRIIEPLDEHARIFAALDGGDVVGTLRANVGAESDFGCYEALYDMRALDPYYPRELSITTKFILAPAYRRTALVRRFLEIGYAYAIERGVRFDLMDCNSPLLPVFLGAGYRQVRPNVIHHEYGVVHPLVLVVHDTEHFAAVGSPFAGRPGQEPSDPSVAFFRARFGDVATPRGPVHPAGSTLPASSPPHRPRAHGST